MEINEHKLLIESKSASTSVHFTTQSPLLTYHTSENNFLCPKQNPGANKNVVFRLTKHFSLAQLFDFYLWRSRALGET